jgi:hypothetical protein
LRDGQTGSHGEEFDSNVGTPPGIDPAVDVYPQNPRNAGAFFARAGPECRDAPSSGRLKAVPTARTSLRMLPDGGDDVVELGERLLVELADEG